MEWGDIRVFLQVARAGQMAGASRILKLDHSTISRRIARLEEQMGMPLFDRAGRRLSLTKEGEKLVDAAEKMESVILREVMALRETRQDISGKVRIGTSEGFGSHYLAARLPRILNEHPDLEIELVALPRTYSLGMREVDLAISMDRPEIGDIRYKQLTSYTLALYGAACYFDHTPYPETVADLSKHLWCGYIDELLFTQELDMMQLGDVVIRPRYRTTSVTAQLQVARSGQAIAILPCYMGGQFSELRQVLPDKVGVRLTYWISVHSDLAESPRIRAVMNAIERMVQKDKALFLAPPDGSASSSQAADAPVLNTTGMSITQPG